MPELDFDPAVAGIDVVVSGHSHRPKIETVNGVLYLNPGSAGPRRFSLPIALAMLELAGQAFRPSIQNVSAVLSEGQPRLPPTDRVALSMTTGGATIWNTTGIVGREVAYQQQ